MTDITVTIPGDVVVAAIRKTILGDGYRSAPLHEIATFVLKEHVRQLEDAMRSAFRAEIASADFAASVRAAVRKAVDEAVAEQVGKLARSRVRAMGERGELPFEVGK